MRDAHAHEGRAFMMATRTRPSLQISNPSDLQAPSLSECPQRAKPPPVHAD